MKKNLSFAQRMALQVHKSVSSPMQGVTMPYGFKAYAKAAASCKGKRLGAEPVRGGGAGGLNSVLGLLREHAQACLNRG